MDRQLFRRIPFPTPLRVVLVALLIVAPTIVYYVFIDTLDHITTSKPVSYTHLTLPTN